MAKLKKFLIIFFLLLTLPFLTGCSKATQLYEKLLVEGIGVDYENNEYILTLQTIESEESGGSDKSAAPKKSKVISAKGGTLKEASYNVIKQTGKEPLYSQSLILILGKTAIENGLSKFMDFFIHHHEFSPDTRVLITSESAKNILNVKESGSDEIISAENILNMLEEGSNKSKKLNSTVEGIVGDLENKYSDVKIAVIDLKKENGTNILTVDKIGIFNEDKFVRFLNKEETKGALFLRAKADKIVDTISSEKYPKVTYTVSKAKPKTKIKFNNSNVEISISQDISATIDESSNKLSPDDFAEVEMEISERINKLSYSAIKTSLLENNSDIFDFSKMLIKLKTEYKTKSKEEILKILKNAKYNIETKAKVSTIY